jgi:vacuolar-type H+-ATPase subunit D/Vma8
LQNVLEILKSNEEELSKSFVQIAESAQHIVNTMVKVLKEAITKKEGLNVEEAKVSQTSLVDHHRHI